jgi:hypothetical protein
MKKVWLAGLVVLGAFAWGACDGDSDEESSGESEPLGEAEGASCFHSSPDGYDHTEAWLGGADQVVSSPWGGYGNGACDGYVVNFSQANTADAVDTVRFQPYTMPTNEADCEDTYVSVRVWKKAPFVWQLHYSQYDEQGTWIDGHDFDYCSLPTVVNVGGNEVRVWAQVNDGSNNKRLKIVAADGVP